MHQDSPDDVRHYRDWLLSFMSPMEPAAIVDLGCGSGEDLRALAARFRHPNTRLTGIDTSAKALETAAERTAADRRISLIQTRLDGRIPIGDSSLDVVYSKDLVECLPDRTGFAQEVARVLRPGGLAVIAHWDWDSQHFDGQDKALVRRIVHAFADWQQDWMECSDGWMGRRLWGTFNATGLFEGSAYAHVLTNTTYESPFFGYARAQDCRALVKRGLVSAEDYARFISEQEVLGREGRFFYSVTGYAFVGRRLAGA